MKRFSVRNFCLSIRLAIFAGNKACYTMREKEILKDGRKYLSFSHAARMLGYSASGFRRVRLLKLHTCYFNGSGFVAGDEIRALPPKKNYKRKRPVYPQLTPDELHGYALHVEGRYLYSLKDTARLIGKDYRTILEMHRLKQFRTVLYNNTYYVEEEVLKKLPAAVWNRLKPARQMENYSWFSKDINLALFRYLLALSGLLTATRHTGLCRYVSLDGKGCLSFNGRPSAGDIGRSLRQLGRKLEKICGNDRYLKLMEERLLPDSVSDMGNGVFTVYGRRCYRLHRANLLAGITGSIITERKSHAFDRVECDGKWYVDKTYVDLYSSVTRTKPSAKTPPWMEKYIFGKADCLTLALEFAGKAFGKALGVMEKEKLDRLAGRGYRPRHICRFEAQYVHLIDLLTAFIGRACEDTVITNFTKLIIK